MRSLTVYSVRFLDTMTQPTGTFYQMPSEAHLWGEYHIIIPITAKRTTLEYSLNIVHVHCLDIYN